ncbi:hypothetical protein AMTRI_Chr13g84960 [Amborella trichopoda]
MTASMKSFLYVPHFYHFSRFSSPPKGELHSLLSALSECTCVCERERSIDHDVPHQRSWRRCSSYRKSPQCPYSPFIDHITKVKDTKAFLVHEDLRLEFSYYVFSFTSRM